MGYDSLQDPHLVSHLRTPGKFKHLLAAGLINEYGEVVDRIEHEQWLRAHSRENRETNRIAQEILRDAVAARHRQQRERADIQAEDLRQETLARRRARARGISTTTEIEGNAFSRAIALTQGPPPGLPKRTRGATTRGRSGKGTQAWGSSPRRRTAAGPASQSQIFSSFPRNSGGGAVEVEMPARSADPVMDAPFRVRDPAAAGAQPRPPPRSANGTIAWRSEAEQTLYYYAEKILQRISASGVKWARMLSDISALAKRVGDGSGLLRPRDFDAALSRLNIGLDPAEQQQFIDTFATDRHGRIDYRDFKALLVDCREVHRSGGSVSGGKKKSKRGGGRGDPTQVQRRAFRSERSVLVKNVGGPNPATQRALAEHTSLATGGQLHDGAVRVTLKYIGKPGHGGDSKGPGKAPAGRLLSRGQRGTDVLRRTVPPGRANRVGSSARGQPSAPVSIVVKQQPRGAADFVVYSGMVLPGSSFSFESMRDSNFPLGVTIFINDVMECRLATCCEHKYRTNALIGNKSSAKLKWVRVDGGDPCLKCRIRNFAPSTSIFENEPQVNSDAEEDLVTDTDSAFEPAFEGNGSAPVELPKELQERRDRDRAKAASLRRASTTNIVKELAELEEKATKEIEAAEAKQREELDRHQREQDDFEKSFEASDSSPEPEKDSRSPSPSSSSSSEKVSGDENDAVDDSDDDGNVDANDINANDNHFSSSDVSDNDENEDVVPDSDPDSADEEFAAAEAKAAAADKAYAEAKADREAATALAIKEKGEAEAAAEAAKKEAAVALKLKEEAEEKAAKEHAEMEAAKAAQAAAEAELSRIRQEQMDAAETAEKAAKEEASTVAAAEAAAEAAAADAAYADVKAKEAEARARLAKETAEAEAAAKAAKVAEEDAAKKKAEADAKAAKEKAEAERAVAAEEDAKAAEAKTEAEKAAAAKELAAAAKAAGVEPAEATSIADDEDSEDKIKLSVEELLRQPVEIGRNTQEVYEEVRRLYESPGTSLIMILDIQAEEQLQQLGALMYLRSALTNVFNRGCELVKYDDQRIFAYAKDPHDALRAALETTLICKGCNDRFDGISFDVSVGIEHGHLLLLPGDYFGDPVNIASKLGEDTAKAGELFISKKVLTIVAAEQEFAASFACLDAEEREVAISGVDIEYAKITMKADATLDTMLPGFSVPNDDTVVALAKASGTAEQSRCIELLSAANDIAETSDADHRSLMAMKTDCVMLQSDMSGFTRLTKQYGILHFLTLVMHCRKIFQDNLKQFNGSVVKYDGDNVIAKFATCKEAVHGVRGIHADVVQFNIGKEKDYQIRVKLGMSSGAMLIIGHDIVGEAWEDCCLLGEDTAEVGEVLVTESVREALRDISVEEKYTFEPRFTEANDDGDVLKHFNLTFGHTDSEISGHQAIAFQQPTVEDLLVQPHLNGRSTEETFEEVRRYYEHPGCSLIMFLHLEAKDQMNQLGILMLVRSALESRIFHDEEVQLIKYDDQRIFAYAKKPEDAMRAALETQLICKDIDARHDDIKLEVSVGIEYGHLLLLPGDYFGDPVNIASKLGEDTAEPGDLLISSNIRQAISEAEDFAQTFSCLDIEKLAILISGVTIKYSKITVKPATAVDALLPGFTIPTADEATDAAKASGSDERVKCMELLGADASAQEAVINVLKTDCVMLQSDMSGFTRLTKQYGILHFLTLVIHCRIIFRKQLAAFNGSVVKYDGDNVIAKFATCDDAIRGVRAIHTDVEAFNEGKDKDYQIRIKLGMSSGEVLMIHHDIVGEAWEDCCLLGEDTAEVGEVLVTKSVKLSLGESDLAKEFVFEPRLTDEDKDGNALQHYNLAFGRNRRKASITQDHEMVKIDRRSSDENSQIKAPPVEDLLLQPIDFGRNRQATYEEVRKHYQSPGCSLIMTLCIDAEEPMDHLGALMYVRSALECRIFNDDVQLMKYDDERVFAYSATCTGGLKAALQTAAICKECHQRFAKVKIDLKVGIEHGSLLLLPGDYFGDPVNIASKLGEDTADHGDLFISSHVQKHVIEDEEFKDTVSHLKFEKDFVKISGVDIEYAKVTKLPESTLDTMLPGFTVPTDDEVQKAAAASGSAERMACMKIISAASGDTSAVDELMKLKTDCVMLQSDMSGFTRLTKKYGIMHFLELVIHCRKIFKTHLPKHNGSVVKYDGDNVIAKFATSKEAVQGVRDIHADVEAFNEGKEKDYQIRIKLGMSSGAMLIIGNDISGEAWEDCCLLGEDTAEVGEVLVTKSVREELSLAPAEEIVHFAFEPRATKPDKDGSTLKHFNLTFDGATTIQDKARDNLSVPSIEELLLQPHETGRDTEETFEEVRLHYQAPGCSLIMILHLEADNHMEELGALMYVRSALESRIFNKDGSELIKYDDQKIFAYAKDSEIALATALQTQLICKECNDRLTGATIEVSVGIEYGSLLLLPGDYFGDPVNVASKLGEDTAKAGEFFISNKALKLVDTEGEFAPSLACLDVDEREVAISGVVIEYAKITMKADAAVDTMLPGFTIPTDEEVQNAAAASGSAERMACMKIISAASGDTSAVDELMKLKTDCVMLQSDMSGFTRLTKQYGILHFLTLVMHCRKIFRKRLRTHNGSVVKYDGDNVIAKFATCKEAVQGVRDIHADVEEFNEGKDKDHQIRVKLGMSSGAMLIIGHDILGEAWEDCCLLGEDTAEVGEVLVTESVKANLGETEFAKEFHFEDRVTDADDDGKTLKHYNLSFSAGDAESDSSSISSITSLSGTPPVAEPASGQSSLTGAPSLEGSSSTAPSSAALEAKAKRDAKAKAQEEEAAIAVAGADTAAKEDTSVQSSLAGLPSLGDSKPAASSLQSSLSGAPSLGPGPPKIVKDSRGAIKRSSLKGTRPAKMDNRITFGADQVKTFKRGDVLAPQSPSVATPATPPTPKIAGQPAPSIVVSGTPTSTSPAAPSPAVTPSPAKPTKPTAEPLVSIAPPPYILNESDSDSIADDVSSGSESLDSDDDF